MRLLRNGLIVTLCVFGALLQGGSVASAHVLRQDGAATAVMHIQPDDNPIAGTATVLDFDFSPSDLSFKLGGYDTSVKLSKDGVTKVTKPLIITGNRQGHVTLVFPEAAVYELSLDGTPVGGGHGFTVTYEVRVGRSAAGASAASGNALNVVFVSIASMCVLLLVARRAIVWGGRYKA